MGKPDCFPISYSISFQKNLTLLWKIKGKRKLENKQDRRQWAQTGTQVVLCKHQESFLCCVSDWHWLPTEFVESPRVISRKCLDMDMGILYWVVLLEQGGGLNDLLRSLPTSTILWFFDIPISLIISCDLVKDLLTPFYISISFVLQSRGIAFVIPVL